MPQKSETNKSWFRTALDSIGDAVITTDTKSRISFMNPAAETMTGWTLEEALGQPLLTVVNLINEKTREPISNPAQYVLETGMNGELACPVLLIRKDGSELSIDDSASPITDEEENIIGVVLAFKDISDRRETELALTESEGRNRLLIQQSPLGIFMMDLAGNLQIINESLVKMMGSPSIEATQKINMLYFPLLKKAGVSALLKQCIRDGQSLSGEMAYDTKWGKHLIFKYYIDPVRNANGNLVGVQGMIDDITQQKEIEQKIRESEKKAQKDIEEKEVLIKEIHHRVKNNLQVISSLLGLQSHHIQDSKTLEMFKESQNRIRSLALVHEHLYGSHNLAEVDVEHYLNTLVSGLYHSYCTRPGKISYEIHVDKIAFNVDLAIPSGLIINELFSNALKHAFPEDWKEPGKIVVTFQQPSKNSYRIMVQDNGCGLPKDLDIKKVESLGLHLVYMLSVKQLRGSCKTTRDGGTTFTVTFNHPNT